MSSLEGDLTREALASRAAVDPGYLDVLIDRGILARRDGGFAPGDLRRVRLIRALEQGGMPLDDALCAVSDCGPCATFRPAHPDGLRPPRQMRFVFRQERRLQVAYAFPSASEQVARHA